ncbi:GGDEF domain-containing protein [Actinoplanes sp. M2I2]|uniref:GGDEF domain-containing protein n=1 Tax=Actinoplanes sp. M2I2 TaxID=1734444 RepID=UPI00202282D3|nr:GGDEF domain-containing protein [Actinoplanes sp. M2I2]
MRRAHGYVLPNVITGVLTALSIVWFAANAVAPAGPGWLGWVFAPLVIGINLGQLRRLASSPGITPEGRRFWRHLAIAQGVIIAATLITAWDTVTDPQTVTLADPANGLFALCILVVLWALLRLPARHPIRGTAVLRFGLDAAVVMLTVGLFGWFLYFRNYDELVSAVGSPEPVMALMLFACAAALAFSKLAIAGARGVDRRTMYYLGFCVVTSAVVGAMLPRLAARPDLNAIAVSVPLTFFLFGLTLERERSLLGTAPKEVTSRRPFSLAPYIAVAATDGLVLYTGGSSAVVTFVGVALTAIVVGRQFLAFYDNARLLREVQEARSQLEHLASHDALTGLANRRLFEERLDDALGSGEPAAVALIDLDDFKGVNDRLGHHVGDELLVTVGRRLRAAVGEGDLVARLGGDEFALLLGPASASAPERVLDRMAAEMAAPVTIDRHELPVRCSVGLATGRPDTGPGELLRRADVAMYASKAAGKGRSALYDPAMDRRTEPVVEWEAAPAWG